MLGQASEGLVKQVAMGISAWRPSTQQQLLLGTYGKQLAGALWSLPFLFSTLERQFSDHPGHQVGLWLLGSSPDPTETCPQPQRAL